MRAAVPAPRAGAPRWALSFADLCLLLLGFFVILHAQSAHRARLAGGMRAAFGGGHKSAFEGDYAAADLFTPGEAVFRPGKAAALTAIGARAAATEAAVSVESEGTDAGSARFDGWELAAARAAAIARAIRSGGVDEKRIDVAIPAMDGAHAGKGQRIAVTLR